jgi:hypothetical protein
MAYNEIRLVSPAGVSVAVGSAAEEVNLRARGYRDAPAEPTPAAAAKAVATAQAKSEAAQSALASSKKAASESISALNADLSKSDK